MEVENWIWRDALPVEEIDLPGEPLHDSDTLSQIEGHFAVHSQDGSRHRFIRDPLGVNKLFFGFTESGNVVSSNYLIKLRQQEIEARRIWSVPSGHTLELDTHTHEWALHKYRSMDYVQSEDPGDLQPEADRIRSRLEGIFRMLRGAIGDRPLYVTMSGGLDSSTIAALAREWLGEFTGLTFCLEDDRDRTDGDLHHAREMAQHLGVEHHIITASSDSMLELLDPVLIYGQDYRDFNVHCGLVNAVIGQAVQTFTEATDPRPVLLTGDAMNEIMADYSPVQYKGREYYGLPRMPAGRLRRFLVSGLDSGDREVGIFSHFGIDTIQPFALAADAYANVPGSVLHRDEAKQQLVRQVMGQSIPESIYSRPKVRAQVASANEVGGTLGALIDRNIEGEFLKQRFGELMDMSDQEIGELIRGGFYRFRSEYPDE